VNHQNHFFVFQKNDRIAQGIINKIYQPIIVEVEELSETDRGTGGFGSTGGMRRTGA
jgi:dUTP pyrophosphatase